MQRFFLPTIQLSLSSNFIITKAHQSELWHQLKNVLRTKIGDPYVFFGIDSYEFICELKNIDKDGFHFFTQSKREVFTELLFTLTLIQALPQKAEKWEWILQKGTELGVTKFVPLLTERTQRSQLPKPERMERILVEAVEQSGRTKLPEILEPVALKSLQANKGTQMLFASLNSDKSLLDAIQPSINKRAIIIGPEGGFSKTEEDYLLSIEALPYTLGPRVLRLETAAIVSLGILTAKFTQ